MVENLGLGFYFQKMLKKRLFKKKFSSVTEMINISFRKFEKYRETYKEKYSCNLTAQR